jgi:gas vesicle protein
MENDRMEDREARGDGASKFAYLLIGLGLGALIGVLFAPSSGEETRDYLSRRAEEGRDFAQRKARELRDQAGDLVDRGKNAAQQGKETVAAAVDAGRDAYQREKAKPL